MKTVAIMQPTFLPWVGYFDLIDLVHEFVFLDNVQFVKQSWQQRNRILGPKGLEWLTVPVFTSGRFGQKIFDVEIRSECFPDKQLRTIEHHYSRAPFFNHYWDELCSRFKSLEDNSSLASLNMLLIRWLSDSLQIDGNFHVASELGSEHGRSERLVDIIHTLGGDRYVSPIGATAYLKQDKTVFSSSGIEVMIHKYCPRPYKQLQPGFASGASAIDILFNQGADAGQIIRSGREGLWALNEISDE